MLDSGVYVSSHNLAERVVGVRVNWRAQAASAGLGLHHDVRASMKPGDLMKRRTGQQLSTKEIYIEMVRMGRWEDREEVLQVI